MDTKDAVLKLLQERKAEAESKTDTGKLRAEWLQGVEALFSEIRGWLEQPEREGLVKVISDAVTLHEENLGSYDAPVLRMEFPGAVVDARPIARRVIGAWGRVDLERPPRKVRLVRLETGNWALLEQKIEEGRRRILLPFDQECFWEIIGQLVEET